MSFPSITNRGEFFSNHYLDAIIGGDLGDLRKRWDELESHHQDTARKRLRGAPSEFFTARVAAAESRSAGHVDAVKALNAVVLRALGFEPHAETIDLKRNTTDLLQVPVAAKAETGTGLLLVALDAGVADSPDELFDDAEVGATMAGGLLDPLWREGDKKQVASVADAVGEVFSTDDPPRYVMVAAGALVLLAERAKWADGRYLVVDLDAAFERNDTKAKGEIETIAAIFSADALLPDDGQSVLDELVDKSHKHAVGVSKELRAGIRDSIELLANEVIEQLDAAARDNRKKLFSRGDVDATELTRQCLRYLYRLLVLLYAESRPELGILPVDDQAYVQGYSLDRLRELTLVDLDAGAARNGSHFDESLTKLFDLVNSGYHAEHAQQSLALDVLASDTPTREEYLQFPGLDAALFDPRSTEYLDDVTLRNQVLQQVLHKLMLAPGKKKKSDAAGFISYAQLGINQLGAVYEGLMAYTGFFADRDLFEVAKDGDPEDGTWMLPAEDADAYPDDVFVTRRDEITGVAERVRHPRGSFVFRLSGRDRQRSASYYTPEVLTRCVVKHALAELLGTDDYAPVNGSSGIKPGEAQKLLDLTVCEPALGSGAFANEAVNQLSAEYLKRRQVELGETLDADRYNRELQKVKAHFALHQTYGVDLNATAVELAEVSLWLNAMYPGLKAPWFGLQLRQGNSLIGCRRTTWTTDQLGDRPWANLKKGQIQPPVDHKLSDGPLAADEIHHFLLPGHGWATVADRKEAKELRPDEVQILKGWRKTILAAPKKTDAKRLASIAAAVESLWAGAAELIRLTQQDLRRPIDLYGAPLTDRRPNISRAEAERAINNPDSPLGRLRTLMDAWIGLWYWPLDSNAEPPTWHEWLAVVEHLVRPDERRQPVGQLDLFDDLAALLENQQRLAFGQTPVNELRELHPWLDIAVTSARREGAFHWELEFAPAFATGGFHLQIGNPPWVRPIWKDNLVLAETDPWWGTTSKPSEAAQKQRRAQNLTHATAQTDYLHELARAEGMVEHLGSPLNRPVLAGIQTNLYMVFMDATWKHLHPNGTIGLLHPEGHFTDPKAGRLRRATYHHFRRHWQFVNELQLFEDVGHTREYGIQIMAASQSSIDFAQVSSVYHPDVVDNSLEHDGNGPLPGMQHAQGGWDLRPHRARVVTITEPVLSDWAQVFDEPDTHAAEARLLRPITTADVEALAVLAGQSCRLADVAYHWTSGWHEKGAKADGTIEWDAMTGVPDGWQEAVLQGPHLTVANPFAKQPNEHCMSKGDYSAWDLETLPERSIPRTNYKRMCDLDTYRSRLDHWNGKPNTESWRFAWRRMTQPGMERSVQGAIVPIQATHVGTVCSTALESPLATVHMAGMFCTVPVDYLAKASGTSDLWMDRFQRFPLPVSSSLLVSLEARILRLNCLTADYAPLWEELWDPTWRNDRWTDPYFDRLPLGDVGNEWTMATPLRRDFERRLALVELDALAALMLGLTAEQLCAMYRTQFAVLQKYEYKMAFDAAGRKICGHHQSAGFRQAQLQDQAKAGDLPAEWKSIWKLYEQYEDRPDSVDWLGHYTAPFYRPDRELEMTRAYNEFQRRLDAGEYDS